MRCLLDECVDRRFAAYVDGHEVRTVVDMGWTGVKNGQLLALAEQEFDALITVDRNLPHQQSLSKFNIAVIILRAPTNRLVDLLQLTPALLAVLPNVQPGQAVFIDVAS